MNNVQAMGHETATRPGAIVSAEFGRRENTRWATIAVNLALNLLALPVHRWKKQHHQEQAPPV
jgi:hypothetical protein